MLEAASICGIRRSLGSLVAFVKAAIGLKMSAKNFVVEIDWWTELAMLT
jgi:hypothetical protein